MKRRKTDGRIVINGVDFTDHFLSSRLHAEPDSIVFMILDIAWTAELERAVNAVKEQGDRRRTWSRETMNAMMRCTDDLMLDKPCVCGGTHKPATDCYIRDALKRV